MGIIGLAIIISIIIAIVFGWDYMVGIWEKIFEYTQRLIEAGLMRLENEP